MTRKWVIFYRGSDLRAHGAAHTLAAMTAAGLSNLRATMLVAALLALIVLVAPAAGATKRHCGMIGPKDADTGLYKITAERLSCRKTRRILTRWYNDPEAPASGPRGWECTTRQKSEFATRTTCRHGHFRIAWTQYSG
jgi:hypothetical protein